MRFFSSPSHEPWPRRDPDPCASAFPTISHHSLSWSVSLGSLHTHHNAPRCPCGTTSAAAQLEGEGAYGQRMWETRVCKRQCLRIAEVKRVYTNKLSVIAHQNQPPASITVSANQTVEYTSARRTLSAPEQPITIVILLIYRSLGAALPPKYHTDRRGVRWDSVNLWTTTIIIP